MTKRYEHMCNDCCFERYADYHEAMRDDWVPIQAPKSGKRKCIYCKKKSSDLWRRE